MLRHLGLKGFKSFVCEGVELSNLTILVGANAAGKSNLLDAIRFLQGIALDMSFIDVLHGRSEGGHQVWPGLRGGVSEVVRKGEKEFLIQSVWRTNHGPFAHTIGLEAGKHPLLYSEYLTSSAIAGSAMAGYLFNTHAPALRDQRGRDEGASIRVALKRVGRGNSPAQTHSASRSLLSQVKTDPPVNPEVARACSALKSAMRNAFFLDITPSRMREFVPKHTDQLGLEGKTSVPLPGPCAKTRKRSRISSTGSPSCARRNSRRSNLLRRNSAT